MFSSVHGGRNLHHGARRTYLTLCQRYPGHGVPMRVIQDLVSGCPQCQKDRCLAHPIPHSSTQTLMQHSIDTVLLAKAAKGPRMASRYSAEDKTISPARSSLWMTSWSSQRDLFTMTSWSTRLNYPIVQIDDEINHDKETCT
jgi:hypothetical protein